MKKTLFAGLLLATMGTATMSANTISNAQPETAQTCVVTYVTKKVNGCTVTYKVTTKYFFCIPICQTKCEVKRVCGGDGTGSGENF
jgi:hypothetical protein